LHARPAARLVEEASRHICRLAIQHRERQANARSILQLLALGVRDGEEVVIRAEGEGEEQALAALTRLFQEDLRGPPL